jgi:hypothetical protein
MLSNNKISQAKLRKALKKAGKVPISDYILEDTKEKLKRIKDEKGYRRIGDAIDEVLKDFPLGEK